MIGKTILHYKIVKKLGEGGMGIVYLAEDTKLERKVAIKFLPRFIAGNSNERKRFEVEAKAAAALNHPNIATIHAIEEVDDNVFIVMEYIDGIELKEKLSSGPLEVDEATNIALQIARGIEAAHKKNIIHRDIKSSNIMITRSGQAKVMDFGLAKVHGGVELTKEQSTIGTAAYMSPEQARGEPVDQRTDIWSFGVVFYEMLSAELPFKGDYEQAIIFSILNSDPDFSGLKKSNIPDELVNILTKLFDKNKNQRNQTIGEVIPLLSPAPTDLVRRRSKHQYVIYTVLGLLIIFLILWNQFGSKDELIEKPESIITKLTFDPGLEDEPTFSPDGKFLAYTIDDQENFDIMVKPLDGGKVIRIVDHPADDAQPSWSPDGNTIAFVSSRERADHLSIILDQAPLTQYIYAKYGDIFTVPALGGQPKKIVENGYYPQWSPDGKMLAYQSDSSGKWDIWITPLKGGAPIQITQNSDFDYQPAWSQDGKWIVFASRPHLQANFFIKVIPAQGGEPVILLETEDWILNPRFSSDDEYVIYSTSGSYAFNISKLAVDLDNKKSKEKARSITLSESEDVNLSIESRGNRIAYSSVTNVPDIYELNLSSGQINGITSDNADNDLAQLSPDGTKLVYNSTRGGTESGWIKDLQTNEFYSLETQGVVNRWTPDGASIIYVTDEGIAQKKLGDANATIIVSDEKGSISSYNFPMMSWDSRYVAFSDSGIHIFDLKEKSSKKLTSHFQDNHPTWSPDSRQIVFQRGQGADRDLYITDLNGNERQLTSGSSEDSHPFWSPVNPDEILFLRDHKNLFLISVKTGQIKQLTNYKKANISLDYPSFSFDGKKVYYSFFNKIGDIFILENY